MVKENKSKFKIQIDNYYQINENGKFVLDNDQIKAIVLKMIELKNELNITIKTILLDNNVVRVAIYQHLIDMEPLSFSSRRKIVEVFLKTAFKNATLKTIDGKEIRLFSSGAKKISRSPTNHQQEIALYSDKLVQVAQYDKTVCSNKNKRFKGVIHFYKSFILFDGVLLTANLNIREDASGLNLYDINKIAMIGDTSSVGWAYITAKNNLIDCESNVNCSTNNRNKENKKR